MANVSIPLIGNRSLARLDSLCSYSAKYVGITGVSGEGETYEMPVGYDGVHISPSLPLTYRENWDPVLPTKASVKGTTLTNLEIDANFKVLEQAIISWRESLDWARAIIAARWLTIVDVFNTPGKSQSSYLEQINLQTGLVEDVGYVFNGYRMQPEQSYNTLIRFFNNSPTTFYIPNDSWYNFPIGSSILISWNGGTDGVVSIAGEAGVTVNCPDLKEIARRYGKVTAIKVGNNEWELEGNLAFDN